MRRPYLGRTDLKKESGEVISSFITSDKGLLVFGNGEYHQVEPGLHRPPADQRPLEALRFGESLGLVQRTASATVAGRPCVVARTGARAGQPMVPASDASTEILCVDSTGMALQQISLENGKQQTKVEAIRIELDVPIPDEVFAPANQGAPEPLPEVQVRAFALSDLTFPVWRLDTAPGFRFDGAVGRLGSGGLAGDRLVIALLYSRGPDLVEVEQYVQGGHTWDPKEGTPTVAANAQAATLVPGLGGNELRLAALPPVGAPRSIALRSALAPPALQELARYLTNK